MQWIDRYLQAAGPHLPADQRDELLNELEANLRDQLEDETGNPDAERALVAKLGHPAVWAQNFHTESGLIGPALTPVYKLTIRWLIGLLFIWFAAQEVIASIARGELTPFFSLLNLLSNSLDAFVWCFTWITLSFFLLGQQIRELKLLAGWQPESLPPIAPEWVNISRASAAFGLVANLIFAGLVSGLLPTANHLVAEWAAGTESTVAVVIIVVTGLALLWSGMHFWHCLQPRWSRATLLVNITLNSLCVALVLWILWLPETSLPQFTGSSPRMEIFAQHLPNVINSVLVVVAVVCLYEIVRDGMRCRKMAPH